MSKVAYRREEGAVAKKIPNVQRMPSSTVWRRNRSLTLVFRLPGVLAALDSRDLVYATLMPAAAEGRIEPSFDDLVQHDVANVVAGQAENVRIVVIPRYLGAELIVAESRTHARQLIRRHAHAETGRAH